MPHEHLHRSLQRPRRLHLRVPAAVRAEAADRPRRQRDGAFHGHLLVPLLLRVQAKPDRWIVEESSVV